VVTADLIAFLRARLDVDEAVARETTPGPWRNTPTARHHATASGRTEEAVFGTEAARVATTGEPSDRQNLINAEHIVRFADPARVLAEVEAKRRIIRRYEEQESAPGRDENDEGINGLIAGLYVATQVLALPYADHPDYREEWRP
jgi:hypothetical protein